MSGGSRQRVTNGCRQTPTKPPPPAAPPRESVPRPYHLSSPTNRQLPVPAKPSHPPTPPTTHSQPPPHPFPRPHPLHPPQYYHSSRSQTRRTIKPAHSPYDTTADACTSVEKRSCRYREARGGARIMVLRCGEGGGCSKSGA